MCTFCDQAETAKCGLRLVLFAAFSAVPFLHIHLTRPFARRVSRLEPLRELPPSEEHSSPLSRAHILPDHFGAHIEAYQVLQEVFYQIMRDSAEKNPSQPDDADPMRSCLLYLVALFWCCSCLARYRVCSLKAVHYVWEYPSLG